MSRYIIPEIGLGKRALSEVKNIINNSDSPKHKLIAESLPSLEPRLKKIEALRSMGTVTASLIFLKDEFLRDTVRLLGIAIGAKILLKDNIVMRMQNEVMLFENLIQPHSAIADRINRVCTGSFEI